MIFTNKKDFFNVKMIIQLEIKQNRFNKFKICLNQENGLMIIKNSTEKKTHPSFPAVHFLWQHFDKVTFNPIPMEGRGVFSTPPL